MKLKTFASNSNPGAQGQFASESESTTLECTTNSNIVPIKSESISLVHN